MNAKKLISAILLAVGSAGFIGTAFAATTAGSLFLYSFEPTPVLNVDVSKTLMQQFLGGEPVDRLNPSPDKTVRYVSPKDVNTTFEHNLVTGDISFHRNFARYMGDFAPVLPSTEEAINAVNVFLQENKLSPANPAELKIAHVGGLRATTMINEKESGPVIDKLITLTYSREVNGLPVIGPGSKMILDVGEKAEILSLTRHWRELSPKARELSQREIYSLDQAQQLAKLQISKEFGEMATFELLGSQTAYFDNNGRLLQPVYAFQAKIFLPDQQTQAFEYVSVIPAMRRPPEQLNLTKLDTKALRVIKNGDTTPPVGITGKPD
ncbi:MAG: hypothetical protein EPN17_04435 [Methylobacter sp.]|nr:MAG: hypothetical protein EPN17_04435 [Methylobacter sp.]